jgi:tripartite-type tricarboxylate transporter receptor subunit TctC
MVIQYVGEVESRSGIAEVKKSNGVVAPAGTPPAVASRLNTLINESLAGAEVTTALAKLSALLKTGTLANFPAFLVAELPKWRRQ